MVEWNKHISGLNFIFKEIPFKFVSGNFTGTLMLSTNKMNLSFQSVLEIQNLKVLNVVCIFYINLSFFAILFLILLI